MATITKENKIHFFIREEDYQSFTDIKLESFMEVPQHNGEIKTKRIEDLNMFFSTDMEKTEIASFGIRFGRNDCTYSGYKSIKELYKQMQSDASIYRFKPASKEDYLALRDKAFKIFLEHRCTDYSKLEIGSEFPR